jgi:hypothetical protein
VVYFGGFFATLGLFAGFSVNHYFCRLFMYLCPPYGAPECTLILTRNGSKESWPPRKTHDNKNLFRQTAIFHELKSI